MRRVLRALTRNWYWKLGALVLSILLWIATVGEPELVTTRAVPILYKDLAPNLMVGADTPDNVRVELRGPESKLTPASLADLAILVEVSDMKSAGQKTVPISAGALHLPEGVTFLRAVPTELHVRIAPGRGGS